MDLCVTPAVDLARMLRSRELSARELLTAFLDRIDRLNPEINAIVTLAPEQALAAAAAADDAAVGGARLGPLHGLPIAIKDLAETAGLRTTFGSPIFAANVPVRDAAHVANLRRAGAIVLGKTNTPEFGAGSQTFNPIFGATRNPYDRALTPGGSSGGAAAAVAAGLLPFADGSDLAASVRNPAAFCNLVGLRTTPGLVPDDLFNPLSVVGPSPVHRPTPPYCWPGCAARTRGCRSPGRTGPRTSSTCARPTCEGCGSHGRRTWATWRSSPRSPPCWTGRVRPWRIWAARSSKTRPS